MKVSTDSNINWNNNAIQFPRLIAELESAGIFSIENVEKVAEEMDLDVSEVYSLVSRAQAEWDEIKSNTFNDEKPEGCGCDHPDTCWDCAAIRGGCPEDV